MKVGRCSLFCHSFPPTSSPGGSWSQGCTNTTFGGGFVTSSCQFSITNSQIQPYTPYVKDHLEHLANEIKNEFLEDYLEYQ